MARALVLLLALAAGCRPSDAPPPGLPGGGRVAFVVDRLTRVDRDIFVLEDPAQAPWALASGGGTNEAPAWSPEGRALLFSRNVDGLKGMFLWEEGREIERVSSAPYVDMAPSWSPDGRHVAVMSLRDENWEIYVLRADGSGEGVRLTENDADDQWPAWSPAGDRIAFVSDRDGDPDLWWTDPEGKKVERLTTDRFADGRPAWSPDGRRIAWSSERDGKAAVFVMDHDGRNVRRLTSREHEAVDPAWSPDGRHLVFVGTRDGFRELYLVASDGSGERRLTELRGNARQPAWGRR